LDSYRLAPLQHEANNESKTAVVGLRLNLFVAHVLALGACTSGGQPTRGGNVKRQRRIETRRIRSQRAAVARGAEAATPNGASFDFCSANGFAKAIVEQGRDGNCLFRSVSHQVRPSSSPPYQHRFAQVYGSEAHHDVVRECCMRYIETQGLSPPPPPQVLRRSRAQQPPFLRASSTASRYLLMSRECG
jgi:hypothetical protein